MTSLKRQINTARKISFFIGQRTGELAMNDTGPGRWENESERRIFVRTALLRGGGQRR